MKDVIFKGAAVAIATPFNENGIGINYEELKKLIDFNLDNGTDAIVIAGTSGESATMTDQEHEDIIKFTVDYVNKRVPVIAGTGSNDMQSICRSMPIKPVLMRCWSLHRIITNVRRKVLSSISRPLPIM